MQYRNNYDLEIFNGDVGKILEIDEESGYVLVDFDGRDVELSGAQLKDVKLAYAITIHKSQGSTLDCAIIDLGNLLYTAVTRGKLKVYLVGEKQVAYRTVTIQNRDFRCTGLKEEIRKLFEENSDDSLFN